MNTCFVMMPFGGYFDGYYKNVIQQAIINTGLSSSRADEIYSTGSIIDDVHKAILASTLCIADVTGRNPNVSYELGMAHAYHKPVLIITQKISDVPFDYRHLRMIKYDPMKSGWENDLQSVMENTIEEVIKNPVEHEALKPVQQDHDKMKKHLVDIFIDQAYDLDRTNKIFCDNSGNTVIKTTWKVVAKSPVFHLCHNLVSHKYGSIEVRRVYDAINARELDYVTISKSINHLSYLFFFKQFKESGQHFEAETEVYVEGYFDLEKLIATREIMMSTQAVSHGIQYSSRADWVYFPKTTQFAGVYAEYLNHPQSNLNGEKIISEETEEHYLIKMIYGSDAPYQQETAAIIKLPT